MTGRGPLRALRGRRSGRLLRRAPATSARDARVAATFAASRHPMWVYDRETLRLVAVNDAMVERYGWSRDELLGGMTTADLEFRTGSSAAPPLRTVLADEPPDLRHRTKAGHEIWVEVNDYAIQFGGRDARFVVTRDVTDRVQLRRELEERDQRLQAIVDLAIEAVVTCDAGGVIESYNPQALKMFGYEDDTLMGLDIDALITSPFRPQLEGGREVLGCRSDGSTFPLHLDITDVLLAERRVVIAVMRDLSEQKAFEALLASQALHDPLTGLANRTLVSDRLARVLEPHGFAGEGAVLFIDLDEFRALNEGLGYAAGNEALTALARRIERSAGPEATVGRLSSDEFVVLAPRVRSAAGAEALAAQVQDAIASPLELGEGCVRLSAGIGICTLDAAGSAEDVLRDAEVAARLAKNEGRGRSAFCDADAVQAASAQLADEHALRDAIEADEIILHYQPLIDLTKGAVVGFEALARWQHSTRGLLGPGEVIPRAESMGLIPHLGARLIRRACTEAAAWAHRSGDEITVAVNLSPLQLADPRLTETVATVLTETGLPARLLQLEVTETVAMRDLPGAIRALRNLRALGVTIAIDDFGAGYSSLAYLKRLPVDVLKIDGSLVEGVGTNDADTAIVAAVLDVARALGTKVVAEGVERIEQRDELRRIGLPFAQGYLFARPMPPEDASALLEESPSY